MFIKFQGLRFRFRDKLAELQSALGDQLPDAFRLTIVIIRVPLADGSKDWPDPRLNFIEPIRQRLHLEYIRVKHPDFFFEALAPLGCLEDSTGHQPVRTKRSRRVSRQKSARWIPK